MAFSEQKHLGRIAICSLNRDHDFEVEFDDLSGTAREREKFEISKLFRGYTHQPHDHDENHDHEEDYDGDHDHEDDHGERDEL